MVAISNNELNDIDEAQKKRVMILNESLEVLHKQQAVNRIWIACAAIQVVLSFIMFGYAICLY